MQRQHTLGPRTYWNTGMTLSPGAFCHKPNTVEPQRMFQGQTDVGSASLCLWHPCFLSSDSTATVRWREMREDMCWEPCTYRSHSKSLHFLSAHKDGMQKSTVMPEWIQPTTILYFQRLRQYSVRSVEVFENMCTKSQTGDFKGQVKTILTAKIWNQLHFKHDGQRTLITLDLFRGLVILFMRKLKVRLTLYFSDSDLAGIMYLSHSSSWILQKRICYHGLSGLREAVKNDIYIYIHTYG